MKLIRIAICLLSIFIGNIAIAMPDIVVKNNEKVSGLNQHEYANMWWQWAVSMSDKESPLIDRTGINCSVN
ncbi:MAG: hypothetical protein ISR69_06110, partial [Gammaproteobacteria bacterium]|nr:hypothetical protein [Gammaproteobacteria bacterium]